MIDPLQMLLVFRNFFSKSICKCPWKNPLANALGNTKEKGRTNRLDKEFQVNLASRTGYLVEKKAKCLGTDLQRKKKKERKKRKKKEQPSTVAGRRTGSPVRISGAEAEDWRGFREGAVGDQLPRGGGGVLVVSVVL